MTRHDGLWLMSATLIFRRLRQADCYEPAGLHNELEATLGSWTTEWNFFPKRKKKIQRKKLFFISLSNEWSLEHSVWQSVLFVQTSSMLCQLRWTWRRLFPKKRGEPICLNFDHGYCQFHSFRASGWGSWREDWRPPRKGAPHLPRKAAEIFSKLLRCLADVSGDCLGVDT